VKLISNTALFSSFGFGELYISVSAVLHKASYVEVVTSVKKAVEDNVPAAEGAPLMIIDLG
jgi:hypothetical protein